MEDQVRVLNEEFSEENWERIDVPADGWTAKQQIEKVYALQRDDLVFASPLPLILLRAAQRVGRDAGRTLVFHNDQREKKEFPQKDGNVKIVYTVTNTGRVIA